MHPHKRVIYLVYAQALKNFFYLGQCILSNHQIHANKQALQSKTSPPLNVCVANKESDLVFILVVTLGSLDRYGIYIKSCG